jgi:hypothetical protein
MLKGVVNGFEPPLGKLIKSVIAAFRQVPRISFLYELLEQLLGIGISPCCFAATPTLAERAIGQRNQGDPFVSFLNHCSCAVSRSLTAHLDPQ